MSPSLRLDVAQDVPRTRAERAGQAERLEATLRQLLRGLRPREILLEQVPRQKPRGGEKKPQAIKSFGKAWKAACRAAGCPGRIPHDLRRTAVRNFVRDGIPERVAMELTGHRTRSVFERYNIVSEGDRRDAARKLDAAATLRARKA